MYYWFVRMYIRKWLLAKLWGTFIGSLWTMASPLHYIEHLIRWLCIFLNIIINIFFVIAEICNGARKYPNCCKSNRTDIRASACHVPGGNCYCDPLCKYFDDCCDDAPKKCSKSSGELLTLILLSGHIQWSCI